MKSEGDFLRKDGCGVRCRAIRREGMDGGGLKRTERGYWCLLGYCGRCKETEKGSEKVKKEKRVIDMCWAAGNLGRSGEGGRESEEKEREGLGVRVLSFLLFGSIRWCSDKAVDNITIYTLWKRVHLLTHASVCSCWHTPLTIKSHTSAVSLQPLVGHTPVCIHYHTHIDTGSFRYIS